jgi:hypothetical protein
MPAVVVLDSLAPAHRNFRSWVIRSPEMLDTTELGVSALLSRLARPINALFLRSAKRYSLSGSKPFDLSLVFFMMLSHLGETKRSLYLQWYTFTFSLVFVWEKTKKFLSFSFVSRCIRILHFISYSEFSLLLKSRVTRLGEFSRLGGFSYCWQLFKLQK